MTAEILEKCNECNRPVKWDNDMDWYCIDGNPGEIRPAKITLSGKDIVNIDVHYCVCGSLLAIQIEDEIVCINSENIAIPIKED
jgi:hypothetical protein